MYINLEMLYTQLMTSYQFNEEHDFQLHLCSHIVQTCKKFRFWQSMIIHC